MSAPRCSSRAAGSAWRKSSASLADAGRPIVVAEPASPAAQALDATARRVVEQLAGGPGSELPIIAR